MSATEITGQLPKLTEAERERVLQLKARIEALESELQALLTGSTTRDVTVDLRACGIPADQAADLRARLKTFAEDWERPEAAIYDEDPAR